MSNIPDDLLSLAQQTLKNAYAIYSNFPVAASLRSQNGSLFSGCNFENVCFALCICAETNALGSMIGAGEKQLREVLVLTPGDELITPCGACRQRLIEFATTDTVLHLVSANKQESLLLSELIPQPFNPNLARSS
ncbi:MAG: cytidine deaminase [Gammaproteobacteria bacterium]|nr:cytidine deaminase [Gammaproteobacteria bacterium]